MSTAFLTSFAKGLVSAMRERELLEVREGAELEVASDLAVRLAEAREGESLVSKVARVLLEHPDVVELFAEDEEIRDLVNDLPPTVLPGRKAADE